MTERVCANPDCNNSFTPKVHNAKYCSPDCRQKITNKRVLKRYYEKKDEKEARTGRTCKFCPTKLSRYNPENVCEIHKLEQRNERLLEWGWKDDQIEQFDFL